MSQYCNCRKGIPQAVAGLFHVLCFLVTCWTRVCHAPQVPEVRALLLTLRNMQRAPEGAPDPPDLVALQQMQSIQDIGAVGAVGAVVKAATVGALELVSRVRL
jgi:hypothetical protein